MRLLDEGLPYTEISRKTGASTATVTRIAQWLHHGTGGYREALARQARAGAAADDEPQPRQPRATYTTLRDPERLRLAIPNKGRLQPPTLQLLHDAGLRFEDGTRAL